MSTCAQCGEVLIGSKKFCAYCGAPAAPGASPGARTRTSIPSAPPPVGTDPIPSPPPTRPSGYGPPPQAPSPRASSLPPTPHPDANADANASPLRASAFPVPFVVGAPVLVRWADGNRYPGIVQQIAPGQCLVVFPDGQERWVSHGYLERAP